MRKTYLEIEKELLSKTKSNENLKKRVSSLREQVLRYRTVEKSLITQYERVVKDWQKRYESLIKNGWKIEEVSPTPDIPVTATTDNGSVTYQIPVSPDSNFGTSGTSSANGTDTTIIPIPEPQTTTPEEVKKDTFTLGQLIELILNWIKKYVHF